jgi:hypothetical protein
VTPDLSGNPDAFPSRYFHSVHIPVTARLTPREGTAKIN